MRTNRRVLATALIVLGVVVISSTMARWLTIRAMLSDCDAIALDVLDKHVVQTGAAFNSSDDAKSCVEIVAILNERVQLSQGPYHGLRQMLAGSAFGCVLLLCGVFLGLESNGSIINRGHPSRARD